MSPTSQAKRKHNCKVERDNSKQKLQRYEHTELPLDADQDDRVVSVMEK